MTLCRHGGSKVKRTIFVGFDFEIVKFIFEFSESILLRYDLWKKQEKQDKTSRGQNVTG